jgi:hypothetical protein
LFRAVEDLRQLPTSSFKQEFLRVVGAGRGAAYNIGGLLDPVNTIELRLDARMGRCFEEAWEFKGDGGDLVQLRLAAILAADVAGYSRLMGTDEVGQDRVAVDSRYPLLEKLSWKR